MDQWGWELLRPWLAYRVQIPVGPLLSVNASVSLMRSPARHITTISPRNRRPWADRRRGA